MISSTMSADSAPAPKVMTPLPMRGAIMATLISAFRLGDKYSEKSSAPEDSSAKIRPGTAKRILQDGHAVTRPTRIALTRSIVDHLFTDDYLSARELDVPEARVHNEMMASAIDD